MLVVYKVGRGARGSCTFDLVYRKVTCKGKQVSHVVHVESAKTHEVSRKHGTRDASPDSTEFTAANTPQSKFIFWKPMQLVLTLLPKPCTQLEHAW